MVADRAGILTLLFLTSLFEELPEATLAAVVIAAVIELVDVKALVRLYRIYTGRLGRIYGIAARPDFLAAMSALLGVLIFDTLPGLFIGIVVSVLLLLYRSSRPNVAELGRVPGTAGQYADRRRHPENLSPPGLVVLRVESGLYFANADEVRHSVLSAAGRDGIHGVVLDAETVGAVDITAVTMLTDLAGELQRRDRRLAIAHGIGQVRDMLREGEPAGAAALELHPTLAEAVEALST